VSEIERRTDGPLSREDPDRPLSRGIPEPTKIKAERRDPTEWRPKGSSDTRVDQNQHAKEVRSEPLNYQSLADFEPGVLAGIEAQARADLIRTMDRLGITVDERAIKVHWRLVVEGYGYPYPDGFVHPDAPDDVQAEGYEAWKRVVKMAADSMTKFVFVKVWRRNNVLPSAPMEIEGKGSFQLGKEYAEHLGIDDMQPGPMEITATDEDIVDAEIVEEP
jgi:hypothetical protein